MGVLLALKDVGGEAAAVQRLLHLQAQEGARRVAGGGEVVVRLQVLDHVRVVVVEVLVDAEPVVVDHGVDPLPGLLAGPHQHQTQVVEIALGAGVPPLHVHEQDVALGIVAHPLGEVQVEEVGEQFHRLVAEQAGIHRHRLLDDRPEAHVGQDVPFDVDAGRHLDEFQALVGELEDAALGDVDHRLRPHLRVAPAEGDLLDLGQELLGASFRDDPELAVLDRRLQAAHREGAGEDHGAGVLADVDEAAAAVESPAEHAGVDVAVLVALGEPQAGHVEAAAVVEIEHLVLVDDAIGVRRRAEARPGGEHAAHRAGLGGERDVGGHLLLVGHRRDALWRADPEIDDAVRRQFEGGAARDDLAGVEGHLLHAADRYADLPGERRVVLHAVVHAVHLGLGQHHAIHQDAGNAHVLGQQEAVIDDALHLRDDDAAVVARRHGLRQAIEGQRFLLEGDVARRVGRGAADEGDVDLGGGVEQPLLAIDLHELDDLGLRHRVDARAAVARIDVGVQAHLREQARLAGGAGPVELRDHALRQVVAQDPVLLRGLGDLRHAAEIGRDHAFQQALVVQAPGAEAFAVAGARRHDQGEVAGRAGVDEALLQGGVQRLRNAALNEARRGDHVVVPDQRDRLAGRDDLIFLHEPGLPPRSP